MYNLCFTRGLWLGWSISTMVAKVNPCTSDGGGPIGPIQTTHGKLIILILLGVYATAIFLTHPKPTPHEVPYFGDPTPTRHRRLKAVAQAAPANTLFSATTSWESPRRNVRTTLSIPRIEYRIYIYIYSNNNNNNSNNNNNR